MLKNLKDSLFYLLLIGGFSLLIYLIVFKGIDLEVGRKFSTTIVEGGSWAEFMAVMKHNITHPLAILLLQIITIILVARLFAGICRSIKQPGVIGEIIAGIVLGPSFLGYYFPDLSLALFPKASLGNLQFLSQIGLILFMFVVGMELDLKVLKNKAKDAVIISHASIVVPFTLGVGLAYVLYKTYAPEQINFLAFALFIGISMSITAFPVLARIVQEKGMTKTRLGTIVISCAAADDVTAWCLLAAVIAIVKAGSAVSAFYTIALALLYVMLMLVVVRPFLKRFGTKFSNREGLSKPVVAVFFIVLILSATCTEIIGIHALFGAFLAGVIMPANNKFRTLFVEKVEDIALVLLLPLFFVFTGLRTQVGLLNTCELWQTCLLIITVAVVGKFFGSALAAKFVGQSWKDSLSIGALMNTRGLMELVVLNIGYDLGVLSPQVFAMMVIMALVTTFMTAPALALINRLFGEVFQRSALARNTTQLHKFGILVAFGSPLKAIPLLRLGAAMMRRNPDKSDLTAMHLCLSSEVNTYNIAEFERDSFRPAKQEAKRLNIPFVSFFKPSDDISAELIQTANNSNFDLLLVGAGRSVFKGTLLGRLLLFGDRFLSPIQTMKVVAQTGSTKVPKYLDDKTMVLLQSVKVPVGVLIDRKFEQVKTLFVPLLTASDEILLDTAIRFLQNSNCTVRIYDSGISLQNGTIQTKLQELEKQYPRAIEKSSEKTPHNQILQDCDLVLVSFEALSHLPENYAWWLSSKVSVLVMKG